MCIASKFCDQKCNFSCVLTKKAQDFLKRFSAVESQLREPYSAFFLM